MIYLSDLVKKVEMNLIPNCYQLLCSAQFQETVSEEYESMSNAFYWIPEAACFTPFIAMSSISDYKVRRVDKVFACS